MPDRYLYLTLNISTILVPFIASFYPKAPFIGTWKRIVPALTIPLIIFIVWDVIFTNWGVWGFNPKYLSGIYIVNLPLEEWLFFVTVPYACLFTYFAIKHLRPTKFNGSKIALILGFALIILGIISFRQDYTVTTFFGLGVLLLFLGIKKKPYLGQFFISYLVILIPFFIINGILTGSWIEGQVVWYNDEENFGIRLGTIPVEDAFYGMLLLLMNTVIWEELTPSTQPK